MQGKGTWRVLSPDHYALGRAVRETRARRGLSQEALGSVCGLHRNYVGAIERGEINPTFRTLLSVAEGLGLALSALMVLYEQRKPETSSEPGRIKPWLT